MLSLKAINTSFAPTSHGFFHSRKLLRAKNSILSHCTRSGSDSEASPPEGDTQKQELLARIAMLQAQKVRLTDYLDERSAYLTQFAEEARAEFDKIGEEALKGLDEADARVCSIPSLALMGVLVIVIAESFVVSSPEWQKVAVLGAILAGLATQFSVSLRDG